MIIYFSREILTGIITLFFKEQRMDLEILWDFEKFSLIKFNRFFMIS